MTQDSVSGYFSSHAIEALVSDLLLQLGQKQPEDPVGFMADHLSARRPRARPSLASLQTAGIVQERIQRLEEEIGAELPREALAELQEVLAHDVSSAAVKNIVLQRVAMQLRSEQPSIHAFVKEWSDTPDRLAESLAPTPAPRGSHRGSNRSALVFDEAEFPPTPEDWERLIAWEFDPLQCENPELVRNVFQIFLGEGFLPSVSTPTSPSTPTPPPPPALTPARAPVEESVGILSEADSPRLKQYISAICAAYERHENPYHNFKHAVSVLQGTAAILRSGGSELVQARPEEQLALLVAALVHDVGHPGYNNDYFVKSRHKLAITYNDNAVLENMHCSLAFELLLIEKHNFTLSWSDERFQHFRRIAVAAILNTDMKVHFDLASRLQDFKSPEEVDPDNAEQRKFLLSMFVHAADLGNAVLPTKQCEAWAKRVVSEFHRQSEREKAEGLPFAPFMACRPEDTREVAKLQISFINYVVAPMWGAMAAVIPKLKSRVVQLQDNLEHWQRCRDLPEEVEPEDHEVSR